ncbi:MAG TPA: NUDIX hydrolase [Acidimicrobiales bacterium]
MGFHPVLPAEWPELASIGRSAVVVEGDAVGALEQACSGAEVPRGELVVWAWAFDRAFERVVLVDHPRFGALLPPGGRVEPGEDPRSAALRELHEETGLAGSLVDERPALLDVVRGSTPEHGEFQTFGLAFAVVADPSSPLDGEPGQQPAWVSLARQPERVVVHHWRRVQAYVASRGRP